MAGSSFVRVAGKNNTVKKVKVSQAEVQYYADVATSTILFYSEYLQHRESTEHAAVFLEESEDQRTVFLLCATCKAQLGTWTTPRTPGLH